MNEHGRTGTIIMDTQMHSKASDGTWRPAEVVRQAKERGLKAIALTDHDTTYGVREALIAGEEHGIRVIPGIEIDAEYRRGNAVVQDLELLGLGIDLERMQPFVNKRAAARHTSLDRYLESFNDYLTSNEYAQRNATMQYRLENAHSLEARTIIAWRNRKDGYENPTPFLSKMDVVNYLLEHFVPHSENRTKALAGDRAYTGVMKKEYGFLFGDKEIKPTFYEAIAAVKESGGLPVIAHPGLSKGYEGGMVKEWERPQSEWFKHGDELTPHAFLSDLKEHGLGGIELYNYAGNDKPHEKDETRINVYFAALAQKLGLKVTYGSDCHGERGKGPQLGTFGSNELYL